MNAPQRSQTVVQSLLAYIGRDMKRSPIALKRIKTYDGEQVAFSYHDKRTNQEELLVMSVEVFILSLVRHIPDKGFKVIRHYGLYSRRIKTLCQKIVLTYQQKVKKILLNAKRMTRVKSWRELRFEQFNKNKLECP